MELINVEKELWIFNDLVVNFDFTYARTELVAKHDILYRNITPGDLFWLKCRAELMIAYDIEFSGYKHDSFSIFFNWKIIDILLFICFVILY